MTDVPPASPFQQRLKRRSIKAKILVALLALSLLPLILFVVISRPGIVYVREHVRSELIREAKNDLVRLATDHATIASATLDQVAVQTRMAAFFVHALLRDPAAFGHTRSYSANEKPEDTATATKYILAPGVSMGAAQPVLDLTSNLDGLFDLLAKGDPNLGYIYTGTQSGVFRQYPWDDDTQYRLVFTLDPALAPSSNERSKIPAPLWQAFKQNRLALSPHAVLTTIDPGN